MARIVNIVKDSHICSFNYTEGKKERTYAVFKYRVFVEDDKGVVTQCHIMNDNEICEGVTAENLLKENNDIAVEDSFSLFPENIIKHIHTLMKDEFYPSLEECINELIEDLEQAGIDLKVILYRFIKAFYKETYKNDKP